MTTHATFFIMVQIHFFFISCVFWYTFFVLNKESLSLSYGHFTFFYEKFKVHWLNIKKIWFSFFMKQNLLYVRFYYWKFECKSKKLNWSCCRQWLKFPIPLTLPYLGGGGYPSHRRLIFTPYHFLNAMRKVQYWLGWVAWANDLLELDFVVS